ncbi:DUF4263 domain-containing protein [Telmatobacter sp. DSM 110680]|uniref:DUF4263 domain-containing protein n=1 Tax=Telmatobacter sp. DSM 110680 TaxID=3036704 RepID=A0AAU7DGF3_9BACT
MTEIRTYPITDSFIGCDNPIKLETTTRTRRLFLPSFSKDSQGNVHLRGKFVYQKKGSVGWEDGDGLSLRGVQAGQAISFELDTDAMNKFLNGIGILLKMADLPSLKERSEKVSVAPQKSVIEINDEDLKPTIESLINKGYGGDFWAQLAALKPEEAERFADGQILRRRTASVREFEEAMRTMNWDESRWGEFFDDNRWIFGLGLRYQFLNQIQGQPLYGGKDLTGRGGQKGDYLHHTVGHEKFVVLVEIKRPNSPIFQANLRGQKYRNGVPGFDVEFANALSQVQVNARTWEIEGSQTEGNRERLEPEHIHTVHPRSLLIFGCTSELDSLVKRNCFEIFRGQLKNTEIVTYDELLSRAKFIIGEMSSASDPDE